MKSALEVLRELRGDSGNSVNSGEGGLFTEGATADRPGRFSGEKVPPAKIARIDKTLRRHSYDNIASRAHEPLDEVVADVSEVNRIEGRFYSRGVIVFEHPDGGIGVLTTAEFLTTGQIDFIADVSRQSAPVPRPGGDA